MKNTSKLYDNTYHGNAQNVFLNNLHTRRWFCFVFRCQRNHNIYVNMYKLSRGRGEQSNPFAQKPIWHFHFQMEINLKKHMAKRSCQFHIFCNLTVYFPTQSLYPVNMGPLQRNPTLKSNSIDQPIGSTHYRRRKTVTARVVWLRCATQGTRYLAGRGLLRGAL